MKNPIIACASMLITLVVYSGLFPLTAKLIIFSESYLPEQIKGLSLSVPGLLYFLVSFFILKIIYLKKSI